jgi:hypothetical protein
MQVLKIRGPNSPSFPYYATKWRRIKGSNSYKPEKKMNG